MTENQLENAIHDAWSVLNLVEYAMHTVLVGIDAIEGEPDFPGTTYAIDNEDLSALWGSLEAVRMTRDRLSAARHEI